MMSNTKSVPRHQPGRIYKLTKTVLNQTNLLLY